MSKELQEIDKKMLALTKKISAKAKKLPKVKELLRDIRYHFKNYGWDLRYEYYLLDSGLESIIFNCIITESGYDIVYNKKKLMIAIRKARK